jgi:hypothetical protein
MERYESSLLVAYERGAVRPAQHTLDLRGAAIARNGPSERDAQMSVRADKPHGHLKGGFDYVRGVA